MLTIYILHTFRNDLPEIEASINTVQRFFFCNAMACMALVLATGAGRTFTYVSNIYGSNNETLRKKILIRKHVILITAFAVGGYWIFRLTFCQ